MNRELVVKLIERAKLSADNAYCPYTNYPIGCSLLVDDNIIFGGCNVESSILSCSAEAGEVAAYKAISEGCTKFRAICFWAESRMPYPSGKVRQFLSEFNSALTIIIATDQTDRSVRLSDILPLLPEVSVDE